MLRQKKSFYFSTLSYLRTKKTPAFARHVFCTVPMARSLFVRFFFKKIMMLAHMMTKQHPALATQKHQRRLPQKEQGKNRKSPWLPTTTEHEKSKVFQKSNKERNIPSWHIPVMSGAKGTACPNGRAASSPHDRSVSARQAGGQYGSSSPQHGTGQKQTRHNTAG